LSGSRHAACRCTRRLHHSSCLQCASAHCMANSPPKAVVGGSHLHATHHPLVACAHVLSLSAFHSPLSHCRLVSQDRCLRGLPRAWSLQLRGSRRLGSARCAAKRYGDANRCSACAARRSRAAGSRQLLQLHWCMDAAVASLCNMALQ
jgi:hypothetical protein